MTWTELLDETRSIVEESEEYTTDEVIEENDGYFTVRLPLEGYENLEGISVTYRVGEDEITASTWSQNSPGVPGRLSTLYKQATESR